MARARAWHPRRKSPARGRKRGKYIARCLERKDGFYNVCSRDTGLETSNLRPRLAREDFPK